MDETFGLTTVIYLLGAAVALVALFFIVRLAILSALAEDRNRLARATAVKPAVTHLDSDGL